jgi:hypothetical protein
MPPHTQFNITPRHLPDGLTCLAVVHGGEICICVDLDKPHAFKDVQRIIRDDGDHLLAAISKQMKDDDATG